MHILKGNLCSGCPFEKMTPYYVPDTIVPGSKVMFLAQNPGANEEQGHKLESQHWLNGKKHDVWRDVKAQPLIGFTGNLLNDTFLPIANLERRQVSVGNALRCRPGNALGKAADELPPISNKMRLETSDAIVVKALKHCADAHLRIPESVTTVVAMGSYALYQLTGHSDGSNWRGYVIRTKRSDIARHHTVNTSRYHDVRFKPTGDDIDIFSMMHIAALYKGKNAIFWHATERDFYKLRLFREGHWPLTLPVWSTTPPLKWPSYSAFDTEYVPETNHLIRWSLCDTHYNLFCIESGDEHVHRGISIQPQSTVVIQNALADIGHLAGLINIHDVLIEDLMLAHATLYTGEPHGLNYLNSLWGHYNRYKHLIDVPGEEQLYSALDAYEPMQIWRNAIIPEFKKDPLSYKAYKRFMLPLVAVIDDSSQRHGVPLNQERLAYVQQSLSEEVEAIQREARAITSDEKFNIGGMKKMKEILYKG